MVAKVLDLSSVEEKIDSCLDVFDELKVKTDYLLELNLNVIPAMRTTFGLGVKNMTDMKVLDFVLWSYGTM